MSVCSGLKTKHRLACVSVHNYVLMMTVMMHDAGSVDVVDDDVDDDDNEDDHHTTYRRCWCFFFVFAVAVPTSSCSAQL